MSVDSGKDQFAPPESEYFWILRTVHPPVPERDIPGSVTVYWTSDLYASAYVKADDVDISSLIDVLKKIIPGDVTFTNYEIREWYPNPDEDTKYFRTINTKKYIIIFDTSDGLTKVGPIWTNKKPEEMLENKVIYMKHVIGS